MQLDPDQHLVAESADLDLVTLDLTGFLGHGIETAMCIEPVRWPPAEVSTDDILALAGFPGVWREQVEADHLRFYSFSSGATGVHAVAPGHLYTRIEPEECIAAFTDRLVVGSLGGLSGGPVFAWRVGPIVTAELVGVLSEYQDALDLLYIRRAGCISQDGALQE